jgi:hypothetical protein
MKHSTDYKPCYGRLVPLGKSSGWTDCNCPEYVPKDNLEFLEYCEAKRNSNEK